VDLVTNLVDNHVILLLILVFGFFLKQIGPSLNLLIDASLSHCQTMMDLACNVNTTPLLESSI